MRPDDVGELPIFAYGTLKQGLQNHAAYCSGVTAVHPAHTWGRLYVWQPGIPILQVPEEKILLMGSQDVRTDIEAAEALLGGERSKPTMKLAGRLRWRKIRGDLLVFPDPERRLRILDAFEGFRPSPRERSYERVLVPLQVTGSAWGQRVVRVAWTYVLPPYLEPPAQTLDTDDWQPGNG